MSTRSRLTKSPDVDQSVNELQTLNDGRQKANTHSVQEGRSWKVTDKIYDVFEAGEGSGQTEAARVSETIEIIVEKEAERVSSTVEDGVPYDRGWAWMVALGLFINLLLLSGYLKSSGIFFVALLQKFDAPATQTALFFAIRAGITSISGLYVMNVFLPRFGSRTLSVIGGFLVSLSSMLSSLTDQLASLIAIHSLFLALGVSMMISPGEVLVCHYFKKRRSLALSLAKCGTSIGSTVVPPLITFFLTEYGLKGTLLLYGTICLHCIPAAMLFRPISFFYQRSRRPHPPGTVEQYVDNLIIPGDAEASKSSTKNTNEGMLFSQDTFRQAKVVDSSPEVVEDTEPVINVRKTKSDILTRMSADKYYAIANFKVTNQNVVSDSQLSPRKKAAKSMLYYDQSKSALTSSKHFDTLEALTRSSLSPCFSKASGSRQRERNSGVAKEPVQTQHAGRHMPSSLLLEAVSKSNVIRYISYSSSIQGVTDSLLRHVSTEKDKTEMKPTGSTRSLDSGLGEEHGVQKCGPYNIAFPASSRCRRVWMWLFLCPTNLLLMLDFSLFRRPVFRLLLMYISLTPFVNMIVDYLPALVDDHGVTQTQGAQLLSIIGALDLVSRLICGLLADLNILRVQTLIIITFSILALVVQFVRFMSSFQHFLCLAVLQGLLGGVANCLSSVLIIDFVGLENMGKAIGFCILIAGISMSTFYPLMGYIRDRTGSYAIVYHVIGICLLLAAALLCCESPVRRMETSRRHKQDGNDPV